MTQGTLYPIFTQCGSCAGCAFPKVVRQEVRTGIEIMAIGDIPTAVEARRGQYLEGPAAEILRKTMEKVGMPTDRSKTLFTTAIKCAYPKRKGKQVPKDLARNCHKHIVEEIRAVNPKMVLILGKTAIETVYGDSNMKVMSVMGRVTPIPGLPEDIIAIPVLHPALLQRSPGDYKPFLSSLQLAATMYNGGKEYDTGETKWQILDTEDKCNVAIHYLKDLPERRVSADMETTGLDYRVAEFLVMGIGFEKNKVFVIPRHMRHRVKDFFAISDLKWTWQHGKYDTKVIWRRKIATVPLDHDVMYMHYVLDETSAHDLETLSKVFLQAEAYKYKMNQNFKAITLENYPAWFDALCERVAVDCDYTYQLHTEILAKVDEEPDLSRLYHKLMMPAASFLSRVEQNGVLIYPTLLESYGKDYEKRLANMLIEIENIAAPYWNMEKYMAETGAKSASEKFKPSSPKQMSWMVFKALGLKPRIKKGTSTGADILESIEGGHPLVDKVLEYRSVAKEHSTYVKGLLGWRDIDGRVRTNFSLHVTATGRLSSKEPNIQNLPNAFGVGNIRRAVIPPKRFILMDSDYSGAELRWLACMSECPVLYDIFVNGKKLHDETAKSLFGEDYTSKDKMRAKAVNFGIPYGREAGSFVDEFGMTLYEAQQMIDGWLNKYHGARDFLLYCANAVVKGYYLSTPFGRRRRFGLVTPASLHALQNEARNFPIQSPSSDTTLVAAMELESACHKYGCKEINLVHDSILFEVPSDPDIILEFGYLVNQHMIQVPKRLFGYEVPFESDTDIGFTWGDLVGLKFKNETVEWETFDGDKKIKHTMPFRKWLIEEEEKHAYKYEEEWYKNLKAI